MEDINSTEPKIEKYDIFQDSRGLFSRVIDVADIHFPINSVSQVSYSVNNRAGTVRGFHFLSAPSQESKIIRCIKGSINDYLIDIRPHSVNFGRVYMNHLHELDSSTLVVPPGFAHAFQTLTDDSILVYVMSENYDSKLENGFRITDPYFNIKLDLEISEISKKDTSWMPFQNYLSQITQR